MIYDLVSKDGPILYEKMPKFDFANPPLDPIQLGTNLAETMLARDGIGLAANQVGLRYNVFVINSVPCIVCYNPVIVDVSNEEIKMDEGCLSWPGLILKLTRPRMIKIRFALPSGEIETHTWNDLSARIVQHEVDHLHGIPFWTKVSRLELEMAKKKLKKRT